jgi:fructosamine-3-kinase
MLDAIVQHVFSTKADSIQSVSGGDINRAARIDVNGARYFIKYKHNAPPRFFEAEAHGLSLLRDAGAIRVPQVIAYSDEHQPAYLILEWLERARPSAHFAEKLGRALAAQHRIRAAVHGLDRDNYIGELPQSNTPMPHWVDFYREQRLLPQIAIARTRGVLPPQRENLLKRLLEKLDELINSDIPPSLLHGDLWGGNYLCGVGDEPVIYDPAVYYGNREIELAFTELFGGFPAGFYAAYREVYPLDAGYEHRRALYQLYPLLVHLNLFGEGYGGQVDGVCRRYV